MNVRNSPRSAGDSRARPGAVGPCVYSVGEVRAGIIIIIVVVVVIIIIITTTTTTITITTTII